MSKWWDEASDTQKLAQIDAALELGLTAYTTAANLGVPKSTLLTFAHRHGRTFYKWKDTGRWRVRDQINRLRQDYLCGARVNFWEHR